MTAPRRLMLLFVLLLLLPAAAVAYLGVRLVRQDRELEVRQQRERRETAADWFVTALEQGVSATERRLAAGSANSLLRPDDDGIVVRVKTTGVEAFPGGGLLYYPAPLDADTPSSSRVFEDGETIEYRTHDYEKAVAVFRNLTSSPDSSIRAGALLRLARNLRRLGRNDEALKAYRDLAHVRDVPVAGLPADLVGRRARCVLLHELGQTRNLREEAQTLRADLLAVRWRLDKATLQSYLSQTDQWLGIRDPPVDERESLAAAVGWMWRERTSGRLAPGGRRLFQYPRGDVVLLWQSTNAGLVALVAGPRFQQREWTGPAVQQLETRGMRGSIAVGANEVSPQTATSRNAAVVRRSSAETGLPWTIAVTDVNTTVTDSFATRRRTLLAGLTLLIVIVGAGGYLISRAVSREFAVARLQSDFVSAVSHEFRTPLTSLHQFTTLLNDDDDLPGEKRRTFYQAQARATERLRRLVESLLDFGRMEAGARPYRLEPINPAALVCRVVEDFQRDAAPREFTIECSALTDDVTVRADGDALARALWNLLDNAVKYSGESRHVSVQIVQQNSGVAISVRDRGLGIPRHEQREIFNKFVRGAASRTHGIKGTGIGLAMVRHIVQAHGGAVRVDSAPGAGSTFTISLPGAPAIPANDAKLHVGRGITRAGTHRA